MLGVLELYLGSRLLAFDYGEVRIGVAVKNPNQLSAEPLCTILNDDSVWLEIEKALDNHKPDFVIVGRPRNLEGEPTQQTKKAELFATELSHRYNIKVELQDEAFTTQQAQERIPAKFKAKTRSVIDQYAACIILESFIQEK